MGEHPRGALRPAYDATVITGCRATYRAWLWCCGNPFDSKLAPYANAMSRSGELYGESLNGSPIEPFSISAPVADFVVPEYIIVIPMG